VENEKCGILQKVREVTEMVILTTEAGKGLISNF